MAAGIYVLIALTSSLGLAQKPQPKDVNQSTVASPAAWKEFVSTEGRFAVQFPGAPKESAQLGEFNLKLFQLYSTFEYSVMYADCPEWANDSDPALAKKILDSGLEGAVAEVRSKLLDVKEVFLANHPGRQYTERMPDGRVLRGKTFLAGHRLYQIAITTPSEDGAPAEAVSLYQTTAAKFLDSFRFVEP